jgi:bromodomain-containing factor 1
VQAQNVSSSSKSPFTQAQFKFCLSALRQVKKSKDAKPFIYPVDFVAMNIPHYPSIITHPMDFSTIERKLNASNPAKPDPNPDVPLYNSAEEFIADVRLIFSNCVTFNGPEHQITMMGRRVEELFDKSLKNLPGPEEVIYPVSYLRSFCL